MELEYKYLNMDTSKFVDTQEELTKQTGIGSLVRAIPNWNHGQVLIAAGQKHFNECEAIIRCRRLAGLLK